MRVAEAGTSRVFVGVVRVVTPAVRGDVAAIDVDAAGLGWDGGPWLGWRSGSWISADPARCQLLVIVRSPAQAANAARVLGALEGLDPCIADHTDTLRPSR